MKPMKLPERVKVKKDWNARCGVTVFTQPKGTHVVLRQWDGDNNKYCVDFGNNLSAWFHYSVIERQCEHPHDDGPCDLKPMGDDVLNCFLDHAMCDVNTRWARATYLTSAQMLTPQEFKNLELLLRGFFSAKK